jgi:Gpi18-like mannosyltransferase
VPPFQKELKRLEQALRVRIGTTNHQREGECARPQARRRTSDHRGLRPCAVLRHVQDPLAVKTALPSCSSFLAVLNLWKPEQTNEVTGTGSGMEQTGRVPIDAVFMLVLGAGSVVSLTDSLGSLVVLLTGCYLLLHVLSRRGAFQISSLATYKLKLTIVLLAVSVAVLLPAISMVVLRRSSSPEKYIQDGALQTELAVEYLLQSRNPYTEDYRDTALAAWDWDAAAEGVAENPALDHYAYLPFTFLFSTPFYSLFKNTVGWYDQRLVYLALFFLTFVPLARHASQHEKKLALLILFGLNLFAAPYAAWGGNDSLVLFFLVTTTCLLMKDRVTLSAASLGLACASKHTAWLFVPFFVTYVWLQAPDKAGLSILRKIYPLFILPFLLTAPFILWDRSAFLDDAFSYMLGHSASSYPIRGMSIGSVLLVTGIIPDETAFFPFALLQVAFCLPLLFLLLRRQMSTNTVAQCWLGFGLLVLVFSIFSRFFNQTMLGVVMSAAGVGLLAEEHRSDVRTVK